MKTLTDYLFLIAVDAIEYKAKQIFYNIYLYKNKIQINIEDNRIVEKMSNEIYDTINMDLLIEYVSLIKGEIEVVTEEKNYHIKITFDITNYNTISFGYLCETLFILSPSIDIRVNYLSTSFRKSKILFDMTNSMIFDYQILNSINNDATKVHNENQYI